MNIEYSKVVSRLQQEHLFWLFSTDESHEQFVQFLRNVRNVTTPVEFIGKYKEGAFVIFALLANARLLYQRMKKGEDGYWRNPFSLVMPNGENITIYPILEEINKAILAMAEYLPAKILTEAQALAVKRACANRLAGTNTREAIDDFVRFCERLMLPENHILIYSSQFVHKEVNTRTEADMVGEVARKLVGVPQYTTYTKVLQKKEEVRVVWTGRVRMLALKRMPDFPIMTTEKKYSLLGFNIQPYVRERIQIEEEIRQRQESWKSLTAAPPPISTTN